jgi:hypothetical protein
MENQPNDALIICDNPDSSSQRLVLNLTQRTAVFENCHSPRSGIGGFGFEPFRECNFDEILAVNDFLTGDHRGLFYKIIFTFSHVNAGDLASVFISTDFGRSRIFAKWNGFAELRSELRQICSQQSRRGHWEDDPRLMPVYVVMIFAIVGGIIWLLL